MNTKHWQLIAQKHYHFMCLTPHFWFKLGKWASFHPFTWSALKSCLHYSLEQWIIYSCSVWVPLVIINSEVWYGRHCRYLIRNIFVLLLGRVLRVCLLLCHRQKMQSNPWRRKRQAKLIRFSPFIQRNVQHTAITPRTLLTIVSYLIDWQLSTATDWLSTLN